MNLLAISIIQEYMDEYLFDPKVNWWKSEFEERSYSRWAAEELISRFIRQEEVRPWEVLIYDFKTPIEIISELINELEEFSKSGQNEKTKAIFTIAKDSATEILYLFL
jgi:hypothetical protein